MGSTLPTLNIRTAGGNKALKPLAFLAHRQHSMNKVRCDTLHFIVRLSIEKKKATPCTFISIKLPEEVSLFKKYTVYAQCICIIYIHTHTLLSQIEIF